MGSTNRDILEAVIGHAVRLESLKTYEVRALVKILEKDVYPDLLLSLEKMVSKLGSASVHTKRFKEVVQGIRAIMKDGMRKAYQANKSAVEKIALSEAQWTVGVFKKTVPLKWNFTMPSPEVLRAIVTTKPFEGALMRDWYGSLAKKTADGIVRAVNVGLVRGESIPQITKRIREADLALTKRNAEAIARTSINHVTNEARLATMKENNDIVGKWQFVAVLDLRTTEECMAADGKVYELGDGIQPPLHWSCRSQSVPVMKSMKELGFDLNDFPPTTRAAMDGQVAEKVTYGDWLKRQSKEDQILALGKGKAELFRDGKVSVDRFVDRGGRGLSLTEIRKREGL